LLDLFHQLDEDLHGQGVDHVLEVKEDRGQPALGDLLYLLELGDHGQPEQVDRGLVELVDLYLLLGQGDLYPLELVGLVLEELVDHGLQGQEGLSLEEQEENL